MIKNLLLFLILFVLALPVQATMVLVQSQDRFSTKFPRRNIAVKVIKSATLDNGIVFEHNALIKGRIIEVKMPKRGKQNAYFIFDPISYTIPSKKTTKYLRKTVLEAKISGYKKLNKVEVIERTSVNASGLIVPGVSQAYWFGKGAAKPARGNSRMKSGAYSVYKNSPLVYIEEGDELIVKEGSFLKMKFYYANQPRWKVWKQL